MSERRGLGHPLRQMHARLAQVTAPIATAGCAVAGAITVGMLLIVLAQVAARYLLNDALAWSEELSKLAMVWATFLVTPWAIRAQAHVHVSFFVDAFAPWQRAVLAALCNALLLVMLLILLRESITFVTEGFALRAASLPISVGWAYLIVPVSLVLCALMTVEQLLALALTDVSRRSEA
ncbi:MAG: TRAP transporter small permease [Pseudomonadota bacterium]